ARRRARQRGEARPARARGRGAEGRGALRVRQGPRRGLRQHLDCQPCQSAWQAFVAGWPAFYALPATLPAPPPRGPRTFLPSPRPDCAVVEDEHRHARHSAPCRCRTPIAGIGFAFLLGNAAAESGANAHLETRASAVIHRLLAYGAALPIPSSAAITSAGRSRSLAAALASSWSISSAPTMALATAGRAISQARASAAGEYSCRCARPSSSSASAISRSVNGVPPHRRRPTNASFRLEAPAKRPPASGLKTVRESA